MSSSHAGTVLEIANLSKSYAGVTALDKVQLTLQKGEVHALMGENGAGKSTFMKILAGLIPPDTGNMTLEGARYAPKNVQEALKAGVSMIHQELLLVPELSVAQNLFLGKEKTRFWKYWIDSDALNREALSLLQPLGLSVNPATPMKHLSIAQMQLVEIAKAISNDARIIIMDEPTSALSDKEVAALFGLIRQLQAKGVSIIYISHKMDEIFRIADTITVLRDGKYIATHPAAALDNAALIRLMVGRDLADLFPPGSPVEGTPLLTVSGLSRKPFFQDISFELRAGEVLGVAGLMGAGRTEIARALYGLDQPDSGTVRLAGKELALRAPKEALREGIGYVSEDRKALGLVTGLSVRQNLTLSSLRRHAPNYYINRSSEYTDVAAMTRRLQIKTTGPEQKVNNLSGGNQQKIAIGKILLANPKVLILDEPTRGIDIGAKSEIYNLIRELAGAGIGILLISSELPEILGMSDRILVIAQGKHTATLSRQEATQETIMHFAIPS